MQKVPACVHILCCVIQLYKSNYVHMISLSEHRIPQIPSEEDDYPSHRIIHRWLSFLSIDDYPRIPPNLNKVTIGLSFLNCNGYFGGLHVRTQPYDQGQKSAWCPVTWRRATGHTAIPSDGRWYFFFRTVDSVDSLLLMKHRRYPKIS